MQSSQRAVRRLSLAARAGDARTSAFMRAVSARASAAPRLSRPASSTRERRRSASMRVSSFGVATGPLEGRKAALSFCAGVFTSVRAGADSA